MNIDRVHQNQENRKVIRGIYPIINFTPLTDPEKVLDWALKLPEAGIKIVQVRAKRYPSEALMGLLDEIVSNLRGAGLTVILNDYIELVGPTGADGLHLGLDDYPVVEARAILGMDSIIGVTCRSFSDALQAIGQGATYIAAGSIYESKTKTGVPIIGTSGLAEIIEHIDSEAPIREGWGRKNNVPVCAIGGVTNENLKEVHKAGASMVAVISAIQDADDPVFAAKQMVNSWTELGAYADPLTSTAQQT